MTTTAMTGAYQSALGRLRSTRRNPFRTYTEAEQLRAKLDGKPMPSAGLYDGEYREPRTPGEFFDDVTVRWGRMGGWPEAPALVAVAVAARDGAQAATRALRAAVKDLPLEARRSVRENLGLWRAAPAAQSTGADVVVGAVVAEFDRLGLGSDGKRW